MRILVTGGLGFIGSNFITQFFQKYPDSNITNVDAEFYGSNRGNLHEIENYSNYQFVKGNITDKHLMQDLISKCDAVINFAAESFVDRSISNAEPFFDSNIKGTFIILEILKNLKKKLIHVSTDEVYGSLMNGSAVESSRFNPSSPYAASKASAELLINSYIMTYGCDCIITRCTNNYGPRQFPEKLIPKTLILAKNNKKIPIYGTGKNLRDWLYVTDHCDAILSCLHHGKSGESYNISSGNEIDNLTIIKKILSIMDKSEDLMEFVDDRPGHDFRYSMNSNKLQNELGWKSKTNFESGIENTVNWYLNNPKWWENLSESIFEHTPWKK